MTPQASYQMCVERRDTSVVVRNAELVRRIAFHIAARLPASVDVEDLIQAGMIGLIEASRKFDAGQGASFETYAAIRIRGAIIDEIRRVDWMPRSLHRKSREVSSAIREIEQRTGSAACANEVAKAVGMTIEDYAELVGEAARGRIVSLDAQIEDAGEAPIEGYHPSPLKRIECAAFREQLAAAIADLPEREKLALSLYYEQELNLREIGKVMGVSESRVSQIHGQAMLRLRSRLSDWREDCPDELLAEG
jgi:RNA polymerase sigma factor FliA